MNEQPHCDLTQDDVPADPLDAGLAAAFGPDSGPPIPADGSVLKALGASLPAVPRIILREPQGEALSPVVRPRSGEMPEAQDPAGRYQFLGEIARGGMGAILKGRDPDLGRDIAVKVLLETHQGKTELVQRFVEEAQISGQLQHPGIAPVYELGQFPDKRPYFSMKLVKGKTLSALLADRKPGEPGASAPLGPSGLPRFIGIFEQVCQTLAYAHARGVIHRDLKPSNVMVGAFGEVQVMDWGLAKVLAEGGVADEEKASRGRQPPEVVSIIRTVRSDSSEHRGSTGSRTQAGSVLGTPMYMAPEQARGDVNLVDERADVFGLGAILCEILTGQPPFVGKTAEAQRKAQTAKLDEALARLEACGADAELIDLSTRCLAAETWDRPRDAGKVAENVTAYQHSVTDRLRHAEFARVAQEARAEEAQATAAQERKAKESAQARATAEQRSRRLTLALAASVLAMMLLAGGGWLWIAQEKEARARQTRAEQAQATRDIQLALESATSLREQARSAAVGELSKWAEARAMAKRAEALLVRAPVEPELAGRVKALLVKLDEEEKDRRMVATLEEIRLLRADMDPDTNLYYTDVALQEYAAAFSDFGMIVGETSPASAAGRIRQRPEPIRSTLVAALDDWRQLAPSQFGIGLARRNGVTTIISVLPNGIAAKDGRLKIGDRILGVAQKSDGPFIDIRGMSSADVGKLLDGDPGLVVRLRIQSTKATESQDYVLTRGGHARAWLQQVVHEADPDPWRARLRQAEDKADLEKLAEEVEIAKQPPATLCQLGNALAHAKAHEAAVLVLRRAQERHPGDFWINYLLALELRQIKNRAADAVRFSTVAVALRPNSPGAHLTLGNNLSAHGDLNGTLAVNRRAIEISPGYALAHNNLGVALSKKGDEAGALAAYRNAVQLKPENFVAQNNLGLALRRMGDLEAALAAHRKAIALRPDYAYAHILLGDALRRLVRFEEASEAYRRGHELGSKQEDWKYPSSNWANLMRLAVAMEGKLAPFLKGDYQPRDIKERLGLAVICHAKELTVAGSRLAVEVFRDDPRLADDVQLRYEAACLAALAGSGIGEGAQQLDEQERSRWRKQALEWLRAQLRLYAKQLEGSKPEGQTQVQDRLRNWQRDKDLAGIRDKDAVAKLPAEEQTACRDLWAEVSGLLEKASR